MTSDSLKEKIQKQGGRAFERIQSSNDVKPQKAFAICVRNDEDNSLTPMKVYEVTLSKTDYVGVIDESGEKAIYPETFFIYLDLTPQASNLLERALAVSE